MSWWYMCCMGAGSQSPSQTDPCPYFSDPSPLTYFAPATLASFAISGTSRSAHLSVFALILLCSHPHHLLSGELCNHLIQNCYSTPLLAQGCPTWFFWKHIPSTGELSIFKICLVSESFQYSIHLIKLNFFPFCSLQYSNLKEWLVHRMHIFNILWMNKYIGQSLIQYKKSIMN